MIIDEIKKANIEAMKNKDSNLRSIYSVIINKYMQAEIEARTTNKTVSDEDVVRIIKKTIKELEEEAENYKKVNNTVQFENILQQKNAIEKYLPKTLTEQEIKQIILSLSDKSVPNVMRHFKTNYGATADLKKVGEILKTLN